MPSQVEVMHVACACCAQRMLTFSIVCPTAGRLGKHYKATVPDTEGGMALTCFKSLPLTCPASPAMNAT